MEQPILAEEPNIDKDTVQRAQYAYRIGAVFEHPWGPNGIRRLVELREFGRLLEILELLILKSASSQFFLPPAQGGS